MSVLNEYTKEKHREVEQCKLIQYLFAGNIDETLYTKYLRELLWIYTNLEKLADYHGLFLGMEGIKRSELIFQDIAELDPQGKEFVVISKATSKYIQYLEKLSQRQPKYLMAHVYVRHMGDLYGGKILSSLVPGSGHAYKFEDRKHLVRTFNDRLTPELAEEANFAFDCFITIFDEMWDNFQND